MTPIYKHKLFRIAVFCFCSATRGKVVQQPTSTYIWCINIILLAYLYSTSEDRIDANMNLTIFYLLFAIQRLKFTFSLNFVLLFRPTDESVGPILVSANAPMFVPSKYLCMKNNGEGLDEQFTEDRFIVSDTRITTWCCSCSCICILCVRSQWSD